MRAADRLGVLLFALPIALAAQQKGYIGSNKCVVCHQEQSDGFASNPHVALSDSARWEAQETACESCHGPALEHVEALDPAKLNLFAASQPDTINRSCLACHANEGGQAGRFFSDHMRNDVACTSCHEIHDAPEPKLLSAQTNSLCSSCHPSARAAFNRPFRHKLNEGAIDCISCHDPHGRQPPAQMVRVSGNDGACLKCHADKRGPFPFEHAPVRMEPCTSCHEPHGSTNPRMMTRQIVRQLCLECHTISLSAISSTPTGFHDLRSPRFQNCTNCHSKIHGSFVSKDFLR